MSLKTKLYRLTFPNGKVYVGVTNNEKLRWAHGYGDSQVGRAIEEFGWENVNKEIIVELEPTVKNSDAIMKLEREFIRLYGENCYNSVGSVKFHERIAKGRKEKDNYSEPKLYWEIDGVEKPARDWCAEYGLSLMVVQKRMWHSGLTIKQALTFPKVPHGHTHNPMEYWKQCGCL